MLIRVRVEQVVNEGEREREILEREREIRVRVEQVVNEGERERFLGEGRDDG